MPAIPGHDTHPLLAVGGDEQTKQTAAQRKAVLDAFDRLRIREVAARHSDTAFTFLARFQSTAASLELDERIKLEVVQTHKSLDLLKAVLADPQANKVCALNWQYDGWKDMSSVIPLLLSDCPELVSLQVDFKHYSAFNFVSSVLEHPSNKVKVLEMPRHTTGNFPRFFSALGQSQVSALTIYGCTSPKFTQGLCDYLAKDLLVRLTVRMNREQVPFEVVMSLAKCTRLAKLEMLESIFSEPNAFTHLPKSITKLELFDCEFVAGFDWSFLAGSGVRELDFYNVRGVDWGQLGSILAVHLRAKGLDKLRLCSGHFVIGILTEAGVELGRIKRLILENIRLNDASFAQISLALHSPINEMTELRLGYTDNTMNSIETLLVPALRHPNCILAKLSFWTYQEHKAAARRVENTFHTRLALFTLLQGQKVRRVYCPLRRLPVEMFRLVGEVLV